MFTYFGLLCDRMADRHVVLNKECDLTGKELKVMTKYRAEPKPKDPARFKKDKVTEAMSVGDLEKALQDRYVVFPVMIFIGLGT